MNTRTLYSIIQYILYKDFQTRKIISRYYNFKRMSHNKKFIHETLLWALLATQNSDNLDERSGQIFRRYDRIIYFRCFGSTHCDEGNEKAWIIYSVLEEFSRKRYVRSRFSTVQCPSVKLFRDYMWFVSRPFPTRFHSSVPLHIYCVSNNTNMRDCANVREPATACSILFHNDVLEHLHVVKIEWYKFFGEAALLFLLSIHIYCYN